MLNLNSRHNQHLPTVCNERVNSFQRRGKNPKNRRANFFSLLCLNFIDKQSIRPMTYFFFPFFLLMGNLQEKGYIEVNYLFSFVREGISWEMVKD